MAEQEEQPSEDEAGEDLGATHSVALAVARVGSAQARRSAPATRWRIAIERKGGKSRTMIASAMNVEPQTT